MTTPHPTLAALRGALMVMETAHAEGLPVPAHVTVSAFGALEYGQPTDVSFQFDTLDDLRAWADRLGASIVERPHKDTVQYRVYGELFEQQLTLAVILPSVEAVGA